MDFLSNILGYAGTFLQFVLLVLIIRGAFSRYFPLFLYVLSEVIISTAQWYVFQKWGLDREHYLPVYWFGELFLDTQLYFMMIMLTWRALEGSPQRAKLARFMGIATLLVLIIPFIAFESKVFTTRWNNSTSQLLNFGAAVMNLLLWGALLVNKHRDRQLLTVTAGLGVALAGAAVTLGMRNFTGEASIGREVADYSYRLLYISSVLIFCWAFRPPNKARALSSPV